MTPAIGSQNKKHTGVKIALATVLSFSLLMMPVIAVATTAALPVIAVDEVTGGIHGGSTAGSGTASSESVENAIKWAIAIANDDSHGYCWRHRLENEFDCSSLVCRALRDGGGFNISSITSTHNMISVITASDSHWTWIPRSELGDISKVAVLNDAFSLQRGSLRRGDILLNVSSHTEIYLGGGQNVGAHMNYTANGKGKGVYCDGSASDQRDLSGKEVSVDSYWDDHWDGVLRYVE